MNKLSVQEKHIYVAQGLQRQGAFKKDFQAPQAIDIALNKAQDRVIKARMFPSGNESTKFEINSKFVSDIQVLIKTEQVLNTFKESDRSYGVLPYDFSYLLSDKSIVLEDCKPDFKNATETKSERVICIPFISTKTEAPYYLKLLVAVGAINKSFSFEGFETKEEKVYLVDTVISMYKELGVTAYWETYKDITRKETFLLVTQNLSLAATLYVDNVLVVSENVDTTNTVFKTGLADTSKAVNRDTKADFIDSALSSFFYKPLPTSPLATLSDNKIFVYNSERFLVSGILINYIRKPKLINLALNQGSELSPSVHSEICDLAVQILKKQIEDDSYQKEVADNRVRIE